MDLETLFLPKPLKPLVPQVEVCLSCGIDFVPKGDGSDSDCYCTMCVYGPRLSARELQALVHEYAVAISAETLKTSGLFNIERVEKLSAAINQYTVELVGELRT